MHTRDGAVPRIALKVDEFTQVCRAADLKGPTACAQRLGLRHTTVSRVEQGLTDPGVRFIAATLSAFPDKAFEDLFEVIGPDGGRMHTRDKQVNGRGR
jgi:transcriptional regulator with XRE-family HTH domain